MKMSAWALFAMMSLSACKNIKGTCDRKASVGECTEVLMSTIKDSKEHDCTKSDDSSKRGTWSQSACDRTGAIGACEDSQTRQWYYPTGRITKIEHVAQLCSVGTLLDANGKKLVGVKPEPLADGPTTDPGIDKLISATTNLRQTVDAIARISFPSSAPSGGVRPSGGKHVTSGIVVWDDDLENFTNRGAEYEKRFPMKDDEDFRACGLGVKQKDRGSKTDSDLGRIFSWCASAPFLVVVRTTKLERPASRSGSDFFSGKAEGYAVVFELPSGKQVGGYSFKAESSASVKSNALDADFRANLAKAISAGLAKADPGASLAAAILPPR